MATLTAPAETTRRTTHDPLVRWLPLAGVGYGVLQAAGNLTIGDFPDEKTSTGKLVSYYADHHSQVHRGGELLVLGCLFLGLFIAGLLVRSRRHLGAAAVFAVGGAAMLAAEVYSASTFSMLGSVSTESHLDPAALQAWHVSGTALGAGTGTTLFLLGVGLAGVVSRALPGWVGWTALVLCVASLTPFGFFASLLTLPWAVAVGIALSVRHPAT
jgi:hypothetical protein